MRYVRIPHTTHACDMQAMMVIHYRENIPEDSRNVLLYRLALHSDDDGKGDVDIETSIGLSDEDIL